MCLAIIRNISSSWSNVDNIEIFIISYLVYNSERSTHMFSMLIIIFQIIGLFDYQKDQFLPITEYRFLKNINN